MERERRRETWLAGCVDHAGGGIAAEVLEVLRELPSAVVREGTKGKLDGLRREAGLDDTEAMTRQSEVNPRRA